jgi:hypothetical protein
MKISIDAQIAIRSFAQSLIAGDFGPDDSSDSRSQFHYDVSHAELSFDTPNAGWLP